MHHEGLNRQRSSAGSPEGEDDLAGETNSGLAKGENGGRIGRVHGVEDQGWHEGHQQSDNRPMNVQSRRGACFELSRQKQNPVGKRTEYDYRQED